MLPAPPLQEKHPAFAGTLAAWLTVGLGLVLFGQIAFLYSEIRAVLVVRDQVHKFNRGRVFLRNTISQRKLLRA